VIHQQNTVRDENDYDNATKIVEILRDLSYIGHIAQMNSSRYPYTRCCALRK